MKSHFHHGCDAATDAPPIQLTHSPHGRPSDVEI
jgi:hypothetical protein